MMKFIKSTFLNGVLLVSLMAIGLTSCNDDESDEIIVPETAFVSLYHASPNTGGLDIVVDNRQINSYPFEYSEGTGYLRFYPGERQIKFTPYDANNSVIDTTATFDVANAYSLFVSGDYPDIKTLLLNDESETEPGNSAMIRVVNVSPDTPAFDVLKEGNSEPLVESQSFNTGSDFMTTSTGSVNFDVISDNDTLLNVDDIYLSPGIYYTMIIRGYENPPSGNEHYLSAEVIVN